MNYTFMSEYSLYDILEDSVDYEITEYLGGYHIQVEYPNGYGASIAKHNGSYGRSEDLWELAVLHNGNIVYNASITSDTVGYLDDDEVVSFCQTIRNWDKNGEPTNGWSFEEECNYYEYYETHYDQKRREEIEEEQFRDFWTGWEEYMEDEDEQYDE